MPTLPPLLCHRAVTQASPPWGHRCGSLRAQPLRPSRAWSIEHTCLALRTVLSNRRGLEARVASLWGMHHSAGPGPQASPTPSVYSPLIPDSTSIPAPGCHHGSQVCVCQRAQLCVRVRACEGVVVHSSIPTSGWEGGARASRWSPQPWLIPLQHQTLFCPLHSLEGPSFLHV